MAIFYQTTVDGLPFVVNGYFLSLSHLKVYSGARLEVGNQTLFQATLHFCLFDFQF